jgi:hypothetical protein
LPCCARLTRLLLHLDSAAAAAEFDLTAAAVAAGHIQLAPACPLLLLLLVVTLQLPWLFAWQLALPK